MYMLRTIYQEVYRSLIYYFDRKIPTSGQTFFESPISNDGKDGRDGRREARTSTRTAKKMMKTITKTRSYVTP